MTTIEIRVGTLTTPEIGSLVQSSTQGTFVAVFKNSIKKFPVAMTAGSSYVRPSLAAKTRVGAVRERLEQARRRLADHYRACGAPATPRAARSTRTLGRLLRDAQHAILDR